MTFQLINVSEREVEISNVKTKNILKQDNDSVSKTDLHGEIDITFNRDNENQKSEVSCINTPKKTF